MYFAQILVLIMAVLVSISNGYRIKRTSNNCKTYKIKLCNNDDGRKLKFSLFDCESNMFGSSPFQVWNFEAGQGCAVYDFTATPKEKMNGNVEFGDEKQEFSATPGDANTVYSLKCGTNGCEAHGPGASLSSS